MTSKPSIETTEMLESCKVSSQMLNIRLKLEEKRRQIEMDKRRMELNLKKQRQKLNKAAFLQAVSKVMKRSKRKKKEDTKEKINLD
jgi:calmodulin-regulated spectrin-associated protein